jgi:copper homeostasis protein
MLLEICTDSLKSTLIAEKAGADRIELCADLCVGGTTPSAGLISQVKKHLSIPIAVMIRPRSGDFCYNQKELDTMKADILFAKSQGAEGVVFGVLNPGGQINTHAMKILIEDARPMEVVCHRAFDMTRDPMTSLNTLIELGVDRLLTSGFSNKVTENIELVKSLVDEAGDRLTIMPGSGINADNIISLAQSTGIAEVHLSGKEAIDSPMTYRKHDISMGAASGDDEYMLEQASFEKIAEISKLLKSLK